LFLEAAQTNLMTNSYFITQTDQIPQTWSADGSGSLVVPTLDFDHQTSSDAKVWAVRFRQNNIFLNSFASVSLICAQEITVTAGQKYCFSAYIRARLLTSDTLVQNVRMRIQWYDGNTALTTTDQVIQSQTLQNLTLSFVTGTAPLTATNARVRFDLYDVDAGDDIEFSLFAPQFETGQFPTTRILTSRSQDTVQTDPYDAADQKVRFQFIPGFGNTGVVTPIQFTGGPLSISFDQNGVNATLTGGPTLTAAEFFAAGDFFDLTFQHKSNGTFTIFRDGQQVAQMSLGAISQTAQPITIQGVGVELLQLNVFSRS